MNRFFVLIAAVLVAMGVGMAVFGGWRLIDTLATSEWVQTSATVTSAEVVRTSSEPGKATQREYRVTAEYEVDGQPHTITYRTNLQSFEPRVDSTILVRYNPSDPADARRGTGDIDLVAGPTVGVLGIALLVGALLLFRRTRRGPITLPGYHMTRTIRRSKSFSDGT